MSEEGISRGSATTGGDKSHNRGAWRAGGTDGRFVVSDEETAHNTPEAVAWYGGYLIADAIPSMADAQLIAAAPDMLAVLKAIVDQRMYGEEAWQMARDAIAKAEGR